MQASFAFRTRGGARPGAGRPARGPRPIRHDSRIAVRRDQPIHITCRALLRVGNLRCQLMYEAIRVATLVAAKRQDLRIVHASIQRSHLHLLVEAESGEALTRGVAGFLISAARHINAVLGVRGARVFERYHARSLATPREVRNCIAYVLNNWRHHGEHRTCETARWLVDKYSNAVAFDGWAELGDGVRFTTPLHYAPLTTQVPRSWLLASGWRRRGLVHLDEVPGIQRP